MIKAVSIQLNQQGPVCGGYALMKRDDREEFIYFDVVKTDPIAVIVANRGKTSIQIPEEIADEYEKSLLAFLIKHDVPQKLGPLSVPIRKKYLGGNSNESKPKESMSVA